MLKSTFWEVQHHCCAIVANLKGVFDRPEQFFNIFSIKSSTEQKKSIIQLQLQQRKYVKVDCICFPVLLSYMECFI